MKLRPATAHRGLSRKLAAIWPPTFGSGRTVVQVSFAESGRSRTPNAEARRGGGWRRAGAAFVRVLRVLRRAVAAPESARMTRFCRRMKKSSARSGAVPLARSTRWRPCRTEPRTGYGAAGLSRTLRHDRLIEAPATPRPRRCPATDPCSRRRRRTRSWGAHRG